MKKKAFIKNNGSAGTPTPTPADMHFQVNTGLGDGDGTFQIPISKLAASEVDCTIYWGDGTSDTAVFSGTAVTTGTFFHDYGTTGVFDILIVGTFSRCWAFNNGGDKLKITKVYQFSNQDIGNGNTGLGLMEGCSNLSLSECVDGLQHPLATVVNWFQNCSSITDIPNLELWSTGNWGDSWGINTFFSGCTNLDTDMSGWDFTGVTNSKNHTNFMNGVVLSSANHDSLLHSMARQLLNSNCYIGIGSGAGSCHLISEKVANSGAAFTLVDNDATFITDGVEPNDVVHKNTLYCTKIVSVDSETQLTLASDRFSGGETYSIVRGAAPLDKAYICDTFNWRLIDGKYNNNLDLATATNQRDNWVL